MRDYSEENAKTMAMGADVGCGVQGLSAGIASNGADPGMGGSPRQDPMWMPIATLLQSYHGLSKEVDYLKIEVSRHKLRVAELEHERALRIG